MIQYTQPPRNPLTRRASCSIFWVAMSRLLPYIILLLLLPFAGCVREAFVESDDSDQILTKRISVDLEQEFELGLGDTALIIGTNIEVTFSFVSSDNRCPSDVVCIMAGEGVILLTYSDGEIISGQLRAAIPGLVPTPFHGNEVLHHSGKEIVLLRLNPYPDTTVTSSPQDYQALLVIRS